ncbi:uncharacterized protein BJ171DRAFT_517448 [Polychytrium aggregatum]|uniref:uncharacterized protein n=1 Tax=Polychytrium aggregatum TaxID=110093 RepID=UPI0022FE1E9D|nr:uncharacterized protein BJ171DRAFT_517448 [Polychytrium aggregatum]KAI9199670.1 hypothetical protein BJ171DRAFT_517448 [Polychytrium aggregatum]
MAEHISPPSSPSKRVKRIPTPLICVVVATGYSLLEESAKQSTNERVARQLYGVPKGLYPVGGKPLLSWWWSHLQASPVAICTYIVTDPRTFGHYERWAVEEGFPLDHILNTGVVDQQPLGTNLSPALGEVFARLDDPVESRSRLLVTASDFVLNAQDWEELRLYARFESIFQAGSHAASTSFTLSLEGGWDPAAMHELSDLKLDPQTSRLIFSYFNPEAVQILYRSHQASASDAAVLPEPPGANDFVRLMHSVNKQESIVQYSVSPGHSPFWKWMHLPELEFYLGEVCRMIPSKRERCISPTRSAPLDEGRRQIVGKAHARIGLIGNPSDGFFGKTISVLISNYWAQVTLRPNESRDDSSIHILPNPLSDPAEFSSLRLCFNSCLKNGYYGTNRLILATIQVFVRYCDQNGIKLKQGGFSIVNETNIPRQVGLAGSSAMVTATLRALMSYYEVTIPRHELANIALSAEQDELGISAGHQDRVIQAYGGCVYMDFDRQLMDTRKYGRYEEIPLQYIPRDLWIAYVAQPKDSGKVHNNIKARFLAGDSEVVEAMKEFATLTDKAHDALRQRDHAGLAQLMDRNFDLRKRIYGEQVIGYHNNTLVNQARSMGFAAKLSGSGGCIVGLWKGDPSDHATREQAEVRFKQWTQKNGYVFVKIRGQTYQA